jgi:hypothetical protein
VDKKWYLETHGQTPSIGAEKINTYIVKKAILKLFDEYSSVKELLEKGV